MREVRVRLFRLDDLGGWRSRLGIGDILFSLHICLLVDRTRLILLFFILLVDFVIGASLPPQRPRPNRAHPSGLALHAEEDPLDFLAGTAKVLPLIVEAIISGVQLFYHHVSASFRLLHLWLIVDLYRFSFLLHRIDIGQHGVPLFMQD